jgi:hypothetical protein
MASNVSSDVSSSANNYMSFADMKHESNVHLTAAKVKTLIYPDGTKYVGQVVNDFPRGQGTMYTKDNQIIFTGVFTQYGVVIDGVLITQAYAKQQSEYFDSQKSCCSKDFCVIL